MEVEDEKKIKEMFFKGRHWKLMQILPHDFSKIDQDFVKNKKHDDEYVLLAVQNGHVRHVNVNED